MTIIKYPKDELKLNNVVTVGRDLVRIADMVPGKKYEMAVGVYWILEEESLRLVDSFSPED